MPETRVIISLPEIAALDDNGMEQLFPRFDGRWSRQTRAMLTKMSASLLDLNVGWAVTPPSWSCPCCHRSKSDISRVAADVLLCRLEEHHDHLRDYAGNRFNTLTKDAPESARLALSRAKDPLMELVIRFRPELVCLDCNAADAKGKALLGAGVHPHFSFSPREIRTFVLPQEHRPHAVDEGKVRDVFEAASTQFQDRLLLLEELAPRLMSGRLGQKERGDARRQPNLLQDRLTDALRQMGAEYGLNDRMVAQFTQRSCSSDGAHRRKGPAPVSVQIPTAEQLALITGGKHWETLDWNDRCECCQRTKRETVRKSKTGKWTGMLNQIDDYEHFDRSTLPVWLKENTGLIIRRPRPVLICGDCKTVMTEGMKHSGHAHDERFNMAVVREAIGRPRAHRMHDYNLTTLLKLAEANVGWGDAVKEYRRRLCDILTYSEGLKPFRRPGVTLNAVISEFVASYLEDGSDPWEEVARVTWLIEQEAGILEVAPYAFNSSDVDRE